MTCSLRMHAVAADRRRRPSRRGGFGASMWLAGLVVAAVAAGLPDSATAQPPACDPTAALARIESAEGSVEIRRATQTAWQNAGRGTLLCSGDAVRTGERGGTVLSFRSGNALRIGANSGAAIDHTAADDVTFVDLLRGVFHAISADPRRLRFRTPYMNAGLEGTELVLDVDPTGVQIDVYEGVVVVTSNADVIRLERGQQGSTTSAGVTATAPATPPRSAGWPRHYPTIFDDAPLLPDAAVTAGDAELLTRRAAARLRVNDEAGAAADLDAAEAVAPLAIAAAVRAIAALGRGDLAAARAFAATAVERDAQSPPALLALSYVHEADDNQGAALTAAEAAVAAAPNNALALARRAELRLGANQHAAAVADATRALQIDGELSAAHALLGFAGLRELDAEQARASFERAVELEPHAPVPRIGLGLALRQLGDSDAALRELNVGLLQAPAEAIPRSYRARINDAFAGAAEQQFGIAAELEPDDPTALVYGAYTLQAVGQAIDGVLSLRAADRLGDGIATRSSLLVDEDLSTQSAPRGQLYTGTGLLRVGLLDARRAVAHAPTDPAGHQLFADVYTAFLDRALASDSERFQASLLRATPYGVSPAQLGDPISTAAATFGTREPVTGDLTPLATQNGLETQVAAVAAGNETRGEDVSVTWRHDALVVTGSYFGLDTDGFRANNDSSQEIAAVGVHLRPAPPTNLSVELRRSEYDHGDLARNFDPESYSPTLRGTETAERLRASVKHGLGAGRQTLLAALTVQDVVQEVSAFGWTERFTSESYGVDLRHLTSIGSWQIDDGLFYTSHDAASLMFSLEPTSASVYGYAHRRFGGIATLTLGAAANRVSGIAETDEWLTPKLGLVLEPTAYTTLRFAAFETAQALAGSSRVNSPARLEPVHVAGFNQLHYSADRDRTRVDGFGVEHELNPRLFTGFEWQRRDIRRPFVDASNPMNPVNSETAIDERIGHAYVYWLPLSELGVTVAYEDEHVTNPVRPLSFTEIDTQRLPIELRYFARSGFTTTFEASWVRQSGNFMTRTAMPTPFPVYAPGEDRFAVFDASFGYRLPRRRGTLSLDLHNLLDEEFHYQESDAELLRYLPERVVSFSFALAFH